VLAACLLLTAATVGVDFGWQSTDKGELEYIIQFEPELIDQLKAGRAVSTQLPPGMEGRVRAFRIQIGTGDLPKTIPAGFNQQSKSENADERPQLMAVNTPILSSPPVPLSAARREIQASIDAAADQVAQYTPRSTRTLPQYSTQTGSNQTATNTQAQSQPTQQPPPSSFSIPGADERYGAPTVSRFNDGQTTSTGSNTTTQNPSTSPSSTGGQFSNNTGTTNSGTSGQQAPSLGQFNPSGPSFNTTGSNNNGSTSTAPTTTGQGTNSGQATTGGQVGSNEDSSTRGRWGNRGPQTDHQPLNNTNDPSLVSPVNQNQWTTQQPQQNNPQQGSGQPPLAGGGYGNPNMNVPDSWQTGQGGNNPNYNQNPQQNYQAPPLYNTGNQGNYGQFPQQQQPNQPPYGYPNQNGYQNQGQVPLMASVPQQQSPLATPVSTGTVKAEEKPGSPSDTPAASKPEVVTEVKVEAPEWWFMVAIGFMMSLFFNFWSWKVSQEIRQKYDDLLEDVRDMRSLPEA